MAALMLSLSTEAAVDKKTKLARTGACHVPLKTTSYRRNFGFTHHDTSRSARTAKRRQETLEWEGVIGSLTCVKTRCKMLVTHVESHASAVSLLESGEQRYIKAVIIIIIISILHNRKEL